MPANVLIAGGHVLQIAGGGVLEQSSSLQITTSSLPSANQYSTSYSAPLSASGGTGPYTWQLLSQSGFNPLTWQISGSNVTNLAATILNIETASLSIQVTDSATPTPNTVTRSLSITVNQQIPAGAAALGYTQPIFFDQPKLSEISFVAYASHGGTKWYSGWPYGNTIPPASLYSMNASNVLLMSNQGAGVGPSATVPIISSVQLSNGSNVPIPDQLPVLGAAYYIGYSWAIISPNANARPAGFQFPTQHNIAGTQDIDPFDNLHRFLEKDTNEGAGSNGKQPPGWGGNVPYWVGTTEADIANFPNSNPTPFAGDVTLQHEYGMAYNANSGTATWYVDNVVTGSISAVNTAASTPMTAEQLAWTNTLTDYALWGALNDGSTPYSMLAYYVTAWGPAGSALTITTTSPLPTATQSNPYTTTLTASGGVLPYTWTLVSDIGSNNTWTLSGGGVLTGTPTVVETDTLSIKVQDAASGVFGPVSFSLPVQSSSGLPSAPVNFQLINQGGPNNGPLSFFTVVNIAPFIANPGTKSADASYNYQGLSWLPSTPGTHSVASYNIYRNGTLYDNIATPISITGYIATPTLANVQAINTSGGFSCNTASLYNGQFVTITGANTGTGSVGYNGSTALPLTLQIQSTDGHSQFTLGYYNSPNAATTVGTLTGLTFTTDPILTVTAVSGGTTSISDGKILPGLMLTSAASGFVSGTQIHEYIDGNTGGGGTGHYSLNWAQNVGSSGSPQTFTGWSYNDTVSTNGTIFDCSNPSVVYAYTVAAVDSATPTPNIGPVAYPNAYMFNGISTTQCSNFTFGTSGTQFQQYCDVVGAPVNGPYDFAFLTSAGGFGFQPTWAGAGNDVNSCFCPAKHFECGAFNYLVMDIKFADNTYLTMRPVYTPILGVGGVDGNHWQAVFLTDYCTPVVGSWVHCKIPFSALSYGFVNCAATFAGTGQYTATLTVTSFGAQNARAIDGSGMISGPGIPAGSFVFNYPSNATPPSGTGPWVYTIYGPNIVGTETGSGAYLYHGTNCYKHAWSYGGSVPDNTGVYYLNNIGFSTV